MTRIKSAEAFAQLEAAAAGDPAAMAGVTLWAEGPDGVFYRVPDAAEGIAGVGPIEWVPDPTG